MANEPPTPDTMLHAPVPIVGVFAASVTVVRPQVAEFVWSIPALETVGFPSKSIMTSSKLVQLEEVLVNVHLKV